ncbi:hypothetical protein O3M35_009944 [Rhynocoris fuscipes]|uniref:Envelope protein n=1 Tax=Rhynocoris fuscipes TaxID=488301 RepID=A0AAW1CX52_9HEMI
MMGTAKLQHSQHHLVHHYNLKTLIQQINNTNKNYNSILEKFNDSNISKYNISDSVLISDSSYKINTIYNYKIIINHIKSLINEKLEIIYNYNISMNKDNVRVKRGLINGLGHIIKTISGNLDAYDQEKYDKIIEQIKRNQFNIKEQSDSQYSFSSALIDEYNDTIHKLNYNNDEIKRKLSVLNNNLSDYQELSNLLNIFNQMNILYNVILNTVREIENSLTFCKLGLLHPSIISTKELYNELIKISKYYNNQLPLEINYENILELEQLLNVRCKLNINEEIIYYIGIPLVSQDIFKLYNLYAIPTYVNSKTFTIYPNIKYILKSNDKTIGLVELCQRTTFGYLCSVNSIAHQHITCEEEILTTGKTSTCTYTPIELKENHIQWIQEVSQYLAILPKTETIKIQKENEVQYKNLKGIFLIKSGEDKVYFKNKELVHQTEMHGQPQLISDIVPLIDTKQNSNFTVDLQYFNLQKLPPRMIYHKLEHNDFAIKLSLWTLLIIILILAPLTYVTVRYYKKRSTKPPPENQNSSPPSSGSPSALF